MTKAELRQNFLAQRKKLSEAVARSWSRQIAGRFIHAFDVKNAQYLHAYLPLLRQGEIDSYLLIEQIRIFYPGIKIAVPKADPESYSMDSYLFDDSVPIQLNKWGIPEPQDSELVAPERLDYMVLPLLTFDKRGYRVGYGKGFYDRYLSRCRPDVIRVGLSYFEPVEQISDINELDVQMDFCVTPQKLWDFGTKSHVLKKETE